MSTVLRPVPAEEAREVMRALGLDDCPSDVQRAHTAALLAREAELAAELAAVGANLRRDLEVMERANARYLDACG